MENSKVIKFIVDNLDFIKSQNEQIIANLKKIKTIDKKPAEDLQEISDLTKALEKLKLENNLRINTKPTKYNHWLPRK